MSNPMNLDDWKSEVNNHNEIVQTILNDRRILKNHMTEYLKFYFDFTDIEYSHDFREITLKLDYEEEVDLSKLIDFPLKASVDLVNDAIKVYPMD